VKSWHSTSLRTASQHCIQAAEWLEEGKSYDRDVFSVGAAAHAILEAIGHKTNEKGRELTDREIDVTARAVCSILATEGRSFEGVPEGPMSAEAAFEGRDLAIGWLFRHPIEPDDGDSFEVGLAIDSKGNPVPHSKRAYYRGIVDRLTLTDGSEDELGRRFLIVRDYKSAWSMREGVLKSPQVRGYAVMGAAKHAGEFDVLRLEVANLRTGGVYVDELFMPDDEETLAEWRDDLLSLVSHRRRQKVVAAPGGGCEGCPFSGSCEAAHGYFLDTLKQVFGEDGEVDMKRLATSYATAKGIVSTWAKALRNATKEGDPIELDDGSRVGYEAREQRTLVDDGAGLWADEWELMGGKLRGYATAAGLSLDGVKRLKAALSAQGATDGQLEQVETDTITKTTKEFFDILKGRSND
jgi:hypothetical protein